MTPDRMAKIHAAAFTHGRPWSAVEFGQLLSTPLTHVISDDAGFALIQVIAPEVELLTIAVHPDHMGCGHGAQILSNAIDLAQDLGATLMFLEVHRDNLAARGLYARAEFAETGLRRAYYRNADGTTADAIVMTRSIPARD